jgi:hypothetical protein
VQVKSFGTPPFDAGFGPPPPAPPPPPPARSLAGLRGSSLAFVYALLIIACVCLGVLLNWATREHRARTALSSANTEIRQSYTVVLAKRNDLASFLTDPRTRLFRLTGRDEAVGRSVTIAWQEQTRSGILIGERMPVAADGERFAVWHVDSGRAATACGVFRSDPAGTYFDFRATGGAADAGTAGFLVSLEPDWERELKQPGRVVYEVR